MYYGYGYGFNRVSSGVALDPDAQAFITAASITDPTQQSAVNQLVLDLKSASIWTKMYALYPFVGGSAVSHKWNLKDPRDLDAAYRIVFSGGVTHNSNGITGNNTNAIADTKLVFPNLNTGHISLYSRTDSANIWTMGTYTAPNWILLCPNLTLNNVIGGFNCDSQPRPAITTSKGFFINNRKDSNTTAIYQNNSKLVETALYPSVAIPTGSIYIMGLNGVALYDDKTISFVSIGNDLSDTDATNLNTAVQTFQTTLSRNV